ncbi:hypothetical protein [uncultured Celeribacter sp.]|uniref:hypothetical protein n=1 Tax=uncultured Celeribacter sp. TaxID=1303376 RepID=UPI002AA6C3C7|nr:hypothetical protein [uncultured Celeribacter sp.]
MTDNAPKELQDVHVHLADDASTAGLECVTADGNHGFTITQDLLMKLVGRLGDLNAIWETKRLEIDPHAGKAGDMAPMTAIRPKSFSTASIPDSDGAAVIFQTATGPQAFAMPKDAMVQLAQTLLREAERHPKKPRQH